jgi:WD40 repeat protein
MAYDGFISYSHSADDRLAPALQSGLQRLAKPWNHRRALRIFRDETGLSTNPHLWSAIETALGESEWFVLLASPEAAQSAWVNKEIEHWLATKSVDHMLPVVTDGTWQWDPTVGDFTAESSAVPDALRGALRDEPRHLDVRWARSETDLDLRNSQFRSAVADLAAPMHGIAKDELEGEDIRQHRRARRLARGGVTALALLVVVSMIATGFALTQRSRAERQSARAELQAVLADARRLSAEAVNRAHDDLARSALLAVEGQRLHDDRETRGALLTVAQQGAPIRTMIHGSWDAAALAPDGRTVAVAGPGGLFRVDIRSRRFARIGGAELRGVRSIDFSPDGRTLAVGAESVHLIDARTGVETSALRVTDDQGSVTHEIAALAFAPDGKSVAAKTSEGTIILWSVAEGHEIAHVDAFGGGYGDSIEFARNGRTLTATGTFGVDYDATTLRALHPAAGLPSDLAVAYSPDGTRVAVGHTQNLTFHSTATGEGVGPTIDTGKPKAQLLAFSPDGRTLAGARTDGTVSMWDSSSGASVRPLLVGATRSALALRFVGDNTLVLVTGAEIIEYDLATSFGAAFPPAVRSDPPPGVFALSVSSDVVAAGNELGQVELWEGAERRPRRSISATTSAGFGADAVAFVPGTHRFVLGDGRGRVIRWNADTGKPIGPAITLTAPNPNGFLTSGLGVLRVAFDASGQTLAALAGDGSVALIDTDHWRVRRRISFEPAPGGNALAISPDGRTIAVGARRFLALSDTNGDEVHRFAFGSARVWSLAFSADGRTLAAGLTDGRVVLVDPRDATVESPSLVSTHGAVNAVAFNRAGTILATGNDDGTVRLWDVAARDVLGAPIGAQTRGLSAVVFTPDDASVVAAAGDGTVISYDLTLQHWVRSLCRIAGRNLTRNEWREFLGDRPYHPTCSQWMGAA